jgi:hypothetical protein
MCFNPSKKKLRSDAGRWQSVFLTGLAGLGSHFPVGANRSLLRKS